MDAENLFFLSTHMRKSLFLLSTHTRKTSYYKQCEPIFEKPVSFLNGENNDKMQDKIRNNPNTSPGSSIFLIVTVCRTCLIPYKALWFPLRTKN